MVTRTQYTADTLPLPDTRRCLFCRYSHWPRRAPAWREALPGYHYQFPRDHFEHQDFRTEWWYYTGNVTDARGERFGFELVFFRQGQKRHAADRPIRLGREGSVSGPCRAHGRARQTLLVRRAPESRRTGHRGRELRRSSASGTATGQRNGTAKTRRSMPSRRTFRFHLELTPEKPFVIHGENGVSQKAEGAGRASYYVSFPAARGHRHNQPDGRTRSLARPGWITNGSPNSSPAIRSAGTGSAFSSTTTPN